MSTPKNDGPQNIKIGVRPDTREKFELVKRETGWTLVEAADRIVSEYIERRGFGKPARRRRPKVQPD